MKLKRNSIYCGDCLELMPLIPSKSIDMVLCDLPYGTTRNKWDSCIPLGQLWESYTRIVKNNGAIVLFAQTPFDKVLGASNVEMLRYEWIWKKSNITGFLNANRTPLKEHENILVFYKAQPAYYPQMVKGKPHKRGGSNRGSTNYGKFEDLEYMSDMYYPKDILEFAYDQNKVHPTQKPLALCEYLLLTYTQTDDLILDNTMGSGTTCVAAKRNGRKYLGFEKEEKYFDIARARIEATELVNEQDTLVNRDINGLWV